MSLDLLAVVKEKVQELPDDEWKELGKIMEEETLRRYLEKNPIVQERWRQEAKEKKEFIKTGRKGQPPGLQIGLDR